jgi:acetoin:2,6-dichlorophenolindophenol oxidoreductase subunit beta
MAETRFVRAINATLADGLEADPTVIVLGEDVGAPGGPFGATRGLIERFDPERIRDTPISEAAIVGAARSGLRPVAEIMFMDFVTLAMDALVNQAAKARFMFGGQCSIPLVVRMPHAGGISAGPQHSQCLEAWFAHIPGLKVVCPSNPGDAYGLLRSAIADPDPVIFSENKALYAVKGEIDEPPSTVPIGSAQIAGAGSDVTLVSYGAAVAICIEAARQLAADGIAAEVVNLRSLQPWELDLVLASPAKTHRAVIGHEAVEAFGVGAEIAARLADVGFDELDGPIVRVGPPFMPVPFARALEREYIPSTERIITAVRRALE